MSSVETLPYIPNARFRECEDLEAHRKPAVIVKILTHPGLPARAPLRFPVRLLALLQAA